jgi:predicted component of type VI protein secretion system
MTMTDGLRLVVSQGPQPGQTFMLDRDVLTIGRDPSNSIMIADPQVSRQHARITRRGGVIVIEDLGSTNGTYINGVRLTAPHALVNGDAVGLGEAVTLTYYGAMQPSADTARALPGTAPQSHTPRTAPAQPPGYGPPGRPPAAAAQPPSYGPAAPQPPAAYVASPGAEPSYGAPEPAYEEKQPNRTKQGLLIGCGCLVLAVIAACILAFLLDYFRLLPAFFYEPLRWLGFI